MTKLFIGGLPAETSEIDLAKILLRFGQINTIHIARDRRTGLSKGFAFVEFINNQSALDAIENFNGTLLGDYKLVVKIADEKPAPEKKANPVAFQRYSKVERSTTQEKKKRPRLNK